MLKRRTSRDWMRYYPGLVIAEPLGWSDYRRGSEPLRMWFRNSWLWNKKYITQKEFENNLSYSSVNDNNNAENSWEASTPLL